VCHVLINVCDTACLRDKLQEISDPSDVIYRSEYPTGPMNGSMVTSSRRGFRAHLD